VLLFLSIPWWLYANLNWTYDHQAFGLDFAGTLWEPARDVLKGNSPYPDVHLAEIDVGTPAYYPPLLIILTVPLVALPWHVGVALWIGLLSAAVVSSLFVLGVRDARCYVVALTSAPFIFGVTWGNANLVLLLLLALAWTWREHWVRVGLVVGLAVAAKLVLWPLVVWLLATRRFRAAALGAATCAAALLLPWALIGFAGLRTYPELLGLAQEVYATHGFSIATIVSALGLGEDYAIRTGLVVGGALALLSLRAGVRGRDEISLTFSILAAIAASPLVWEHYFVFLLVPLAIARPKFSPVWMLLPIFFLTYWLPKPQLSPSAIEPGGTACCPPLGYPEQAWLATHSPPALWPALAHMLIAGTLGAVALWSFSRARDLGTVVGSYGDDRAS
jgi:hypothetical protein